MNRYPSDIKDDFETLRDNNEEAVEEDLWFLPSPVDDAPDDLPSGLKTDTAETTIIAEWIASEAGLAARLAHVAGRLGALDDRLRRGPKGWRHRLALIEAADLSWFAGDRIGADRLALWMALRLAGVHDDAAALTRAGWAARRLIGGSGPEAGLVEFLGRQDPTNPDHQTERLSDSAESWIAMMAAGQKLHPISRACMGYHLWALAGLEQGDRVEAAVTAARMATGGKGAVFAPVAMGGAGGLRTSGPPADRLAVWLEGMERAVLTAMLRLDDIEAWAARATTVMTKLSGRTPPALRELLTEWPLISAPMAETLTGASRAAIQRNLIWMEEQGLIREVTGQGRFRMWKAAG